MLSDTDASPVAKAKRGHLKRPADMVNMRAQLADEAVCIGEAPSSESYLSIPNIIAAAVSHGCDALHPVRALL